MGSCRRIPASSETYSQSSSLRPIHQRERRNFPTQGIPRFHTMAGGALERMQESTREQTAAKVARS